MVRSFVRPSARSRGSIVAALLLLFLALNVVGHSWPAGASARVFAQDVGEGEEGEDAQPDEDAQTGAGGSEDEGGAGQEDPEAQTDPEEGGEEATSETGPPWTYQMAWMGLALGFAVMALIGFLYWRLVVRRARGVA